MGSGVRLHRHRQVGLAAAAVRSRVLCQARHLSSALITFWRGAQQRGVEVDHGNGADLSVADVRGGGGSYAAKAQRALINNPARPLQTLALNNIKAAPLQDPLRLRGASTLIALHGLAIQEVGSDQQLMILREQRRHISLNLYGQSDDAYELVTTLATLAKLLRNQKQAITSKFPRSLLADDGTKFGPGLAIVTPGIIKAELVNEYQLDMWNGLVENLKAFKANLIVERDPNDPNRVNVLYPPDLINQLREFAVLAQFRLQYDRGIDLQTIGPAVGPFNATGQTPQ